MNELKYVLGEIKRWRYQFYDLATKLETDSNGLAWDQFVSNMRLQRTIVLNRMVDRGVRSSLIRAAERSMA